jgi:hypothetical protein
MSIKRFDCVAAKRRLRKITPKPGQCALKNYHFVSRPSVISNGVAGEILSFSKILFLRFLTTFEMTLRGQSQTENILHHYDNIEIIAGPFIFFRV